MADLIYKYTKGALQVSDLTKCIPDIEFTQEDQCLIVNYLKYAIPIHLKHYFDTSDTSKLQEILQVATWLYDTHRLEEHRWLSILEELYEDLDSASYEFFFTYLEQKAQHRQMVNSSSA